MRLGSGYIGSESLQTSVANKEIVPSPPSVWTTGYNFYKFSFMNESDCTVLVNEKHKIFLKANQGINISEADSPIYSFKVIEDGINFNWIGAY